MSTVLITGGAGFIGLSLADRLSEGGDRVILLDNFNDYYDPVIKRENITKALKSPNCVLYEGDIENLADLDKVFSDNKIDIVVHLAARAGIRLSMEKPEDYTRTNILGAVNILEIMKKYGIRRFCMASSSSSVYGNCWAMNYQRINIHQQPMQSRDVEKKISDIFKAKNIWDTLQRLILKLVFLTLLNG